jgi:hypothetical protein
MGTTEPSSDDVLAGVMGGRMWVRFVSDKMSRADGDSLGSGRVMPVNRMSWWG